MIRVHPTGIISLFFMMFLGIFGLAYSFIVVDLVWKYKYQIFIVGIFFIPITTWWLARRRPPPSGRRYNHP